jgi:hypothetical protein
VPEFQETIKEKTDEFARAYVVEQLAKEGVNSNLISDEIIENEVSKFTEGIETQTLISVLDTNTHKVLNFINGKADRLIVYLPLQKFSFDIDSNILSEIQVAPDEYEVTKLLSHPAAGGGFAIFSYITQIGSFSTAILIVSTFLFIVFSFIYFSITKRVSSLGKLFLMLGVVGGLSAIPFYLITQRPAIAERVAEPSQVFLSIFSPIVISQLISYILVFSGVTFALGIVGYIFGRSKNSG